MEHISHTKYIVMRRIKLIWFVRRVLPLLVIEIAAVVFVVSKIAEYVFINHVLQNAAAHTFARSPIMIVDFFFRAFLNTEFIVQALLVGSVLALFLFAKDIRRTMRALTTTPNLSRFSSVT